MGRIWNKLTLLLWKNFVLHKRHPIQTAIEILVPVVLTCSFLAFRYSSLPEEHSAIFYEPYVNIFGEEFLTLVWSPERSELNDIIDDTVNLITKEREKITVNYVTLKTSEAVAAHISTYANGSESRLVGITFDDLLIDSSISFPKNINITIRYPGDSRSFQTSLLYPQFQGSGPSNHISEYGFMAIQEALNFAVIRYLKKDNTLHKSVLMQRFPFPKYTEDPLIGTLNMVMPTIMLFAFLYTCVTTVRMIVFEKERQLKETMKIMGLPGWLHWISWFITKFFLMLIGIILMVTVFKIRWVPEPSAGIFTNSDTSVLTIFFVLYIAASITFSFAISVLTKKAQTATIIAAVLWFASQAPFGFQLMSYDKLTLASKLLGCLLSNGGMGFGLFLIFKFEESGKGIQWSNLWSPVVPDDNLVMGHVLIMLIVDTILFLSIALYFDAIFPGEYGVPRVWYFPFTRHYWCGPSVDEMEDYSYNDTILKGEFYEEYPKYLETGIIIIDLNKKFGNATAVKNLSLNIYEDQITVLLGHNGAGKTTTMSMLTGMYTPTKGTAIVGGYDVRKDIDKIRENMGLCPQHNCLFDDLTVSEHLYLFCRLKGMEKREINAETKRYLELLELVPKANAMASTLSGGMKRKLSVGVAFCGGSKVVMCDEPSSGMDPAARRALWDLLQSQKKGRTILLTTHYMDEADVLGDRIGIMSEGVLQCCGSSFFLKKKYGAGYKLIIEKSPQCMVVDVTNLLRKYITDIQVDSNIGTELKYILHESNLPVFQVMLRDLETNSQNLGINSFGISLTNLDEVFLTVRSKTKPDSELFHGTSQTKLETAIDMVGGYLTGWPLFWNQVLAILMKRGLTICRTWLHYLILNVVAVFLMVMAFEVSNFAFDKPEHPLMPIDINLYKDPVVAINYSTANQYTDKYLSLLKKNEIKTQDWKQDSFVYKMFDKLEEDINYVRYRYPVGATFWENGSVTARYNGDMYHAEPLSLQMVMNSILHKEVSEDYNIHINNHPIIISTSLDEINSSTLTIVTNLGFAAAAVASYYVMFFIKERTCNSKHLQLVSGVRLVPFWMTSYVCDMLTFMVPAAVTVIVFAIYQENGYKTSESLGLIFFMYAVYGHAIIPLCYLLSKHFKTPTEGYVKMFLFFGIVAIIGFIVIFMMKGLFEKANAFKVINTICYIIPLYSFTMGINAIGEMELQLKHCQNNINECVALGNSFENCKNNIEEKNPSCNGGYWDFISPGIASNVMVSLIGGVVCLILLFAIEYRIFKKIFGGKGTNNSGAVQHMDDGNEDHDVLVERQKLESASQEDISKYSIALHGVTKRYKTLVAVNNVTLGINKNECFGLLGVNGAGKTTAFKMMTGEIGISNGQAWVKGLDLQNNLNEIFKSIGYCPQFDALLDNLTCKETIIMYSLIRGLTLSEGNLMAQNLAEEFDFVAHLCKKVHQLSGGNKRKLSTALALLGDPDVIYLDEPTAGMDPATKRYIWKALCKIRDSGKCIVLTSHSMEECEALCTRLAIMVNGSFKCLGSQQHLKSRFAKGYSLIIKLKPLIGIYDEQFAQLNSVEAYILNCFPGSEVLEKHTQLIAFNLVDTSKKWSELFEIMEEAKKHLPVEDYSLGQSTLEQVFLRFTKV